MCVSGDGDAVVCSTGDSGVGVILLGALALPAKGLLVSGGVVTAALAVDVLS